MKPPDNTAAYNTEVFGDENWNHFLRKSYRKKNSQLTISARAEITFPRVVRLLLMLAPSLSRVPLAPVESARSDPARSPNEILLTRSVDSSVVSSNFCCVKRMVNTACEREDVSFMLVAATVLANKKEIIGYRIPKHATPHILPHFVSTVLK